MPTREQWQARLEQRLPPPTSYLARNRAITAYYADWYLQEPWLFKWAGMAAFASDQVGVALSLVEMLNSPHGAVASELPALPQRNLLEIGAALYGQMLSLALFIPLALHDTAARPLLLNDMELIKQGNDAIFADVGWAHLAYATGGLGELEPQMQSSEQADLREAFRMIDEGVHLVADPAHYEAGTTLINQGAVAMLRHEQMNILPPYFERLSPLGRIFASIGAWLDFEGASGLSGQPWFGGHFGTMALVSRRRSVTNPTDRWEWIERDVLPKWQRVDAGFGERCAMHRRLTALANQQPTMLHQAAALMNVVYPTLGLRAAPFAQRGQPVASERMP